MHPIQELTSEQQRYLDSIIGHSDDELLLEITRGQLSGITASTKPRSPSAQSREEYRKRVPKRPVEYEYERQTLVPFVKHAQASVQSIQSKLYVLLCDAELLKPKQQAIEALTSTEKDVIAGVATILFARYNEIMAVAIPAAILLARKGLTSFCATKPKG